LAPADPAVDNINPETAWAVKNETEEWTMHRKPRFMMFDSSGRAAETNVLPRRNLALKTSR
jgi:hypothetical protein